ncbi:M48 family metallopeptidase [Methanoculleus sp. Afa-1]|uniref:M48 family metallopeptidase n=1 Tax=Methanoculleus formosensis TaxID=2590886 RepID=A0A9E5DEQ6_9EURY|nr:SprT family zinc-dependent metalloprotease [Methanoculleus sp. Afa-1]MCT8336840.1 M48 family metallopeptidase [Methanoculleus sp. Afa-1]
MTGTGAILFGTTTIRYTVSFSSRRKKAAIAVYPDTSVAVTVPTGTTHDSVRELVQKKAPWILEQIGGFEHLAMFDATKRYVSGETFLYLGRQYRLKIAVRGEELSVKLVGGYFEVTIPDDVCPEVDPVRHALCAWYKEHALQKAREAVRVYAQRLRLDPPKITIRRQLKRWGSCTKDGVLNINFLIIMAPMSQVEYVVAHELCHLRHKDHSAEFWDLLRLLMPDYEIRKERLRKEGWRYVL